MCFLGMYGSFVWLGFVNLIKNEYFYGLVIKKLVGGNVEIFFFWKMEIMKGKKSERNYKR